VAYVVSNVSRRQKPVKKKEGSMKEKPSGTKRCACGVTISANKEKCLKCASS